jgi:23S rRNA pseudouridine2605 synthase
MPVRLHKFLASCGVGSRRQCEQFMREGRVTVDGVPAREPGTVIEPEAAEVCFNGAPVRQQSHHYIALHKPPGYVCTSRDPRGRPRAIDLAPAGAGRLYTVGRLDADSEGLILLTNDGDFAHRLMHPRHHVTKEYELWLHEPLATADLAGWLKGIHDAGERLRVLAIRAMKPDRAGYGYRVTLGEGRNRHLRRMAAAAGKKVLRLKRVAIGSLLLGGIRRGAWRALTPAECRDLMSKSGARS